MTTMMVTGKTMAAQTLVVDPARIGFFRFILEAHDNLALLTTLDAARGLVVLRYPADLAPEVGEFLAALPPQLVIDSYWLE